MSLNCLDSVDDGQQEVESPKKIYQSIQETVRQLDVSSSRCTKVEDLFSSDLLAKRHKIKDLCEKLTTQHSSKTYGSFAREKLWRYVFYDPIVRARKIQREKPWTSLQLAYIKSHLMNGIGQLHLFTIKIQESSEFEQMPMLERPSSLEGILNEDMVLVRKSRNKITTEEELVSQKWLVELIHMCMINIGDLYRYLTDIYSKVLDSEEDCSTYLNRAQECYTQAFLMNPDAGLSHNQLGNLYSERNWGIDSAFYLLYSTLSKNAYEGADPNLQQLLDRKIVQFTRLPATYEPKPMEVLCYGFISMLYHLLCDKTHLPNYEQFFQENMSNFHERLVTYDPDLDEKLLFKFSTISVMTVWRLQMLNSVNTPLAVAFAMSIFFQLVNQLGVILEEHARIVTNLSRPLSIAPKDEDQISVDSDTRGEKEERQSLKVEDCDPVKDKTKRRKKTAFRRRRCRNGGSIPSLHSDESEAEESEGENLSDEDEQETSEDDYWTGTDDSDASYSDEDEFDNEIASVQDGERGQDLLNGKAFDTSSSNGKSDTSGNSQKSTDGLRQELISEERETPSLDGPVLRSTVPERLCIDAEDLIKCQAQVEPLLVALTPFIRWIQTCTAVKDALAANAEKVFLEKLCGILTLLVSQNWAEAIEGVSIANELKEDWTKLIGGSHANKRNLFEWELPEDRSMLGLPLIKEFVEGLTIRDDLSSSDELIVRIGRLVSFGSWMADTGSFSMMYSEEDKKFLIPSPQILREHLRKLRMNKLLDGKDASECMIRLTKAYKEMNGRNRRPRCRRNFGRGPDGREMHGKEEYGEDGRRRRRRRGRFTHGHGGVGHGRRNPDQEPIVVVIDLSASLYQFERLRRLACHRSFIIYVPSSVWKTLDMLKDTELEGSKEARIAFRWMEGAFQRNHPGIRLLKEDMKEVINAEYPVDPADVDAWEYFEMLECCNYLIREVLKGDYKANSSHEVIFGDFRDKYRMFYLTGADDLLDTSVKRGFDPIKSARAAGVFVDNMSLYPPAPIKSGRKWRTSGKTKG